MRAKGLNNELMEFFKFSLLVRSQQDDPELDKQYRRIMKEYNYRRRTSDIATPGRRLRPATKTIPNKS